MKGTIHYHFVGGMWRCAATLQSAVYAKGLTGFGATYAEARNALTDQIINKQGTECFVPPDEEIEF